MFKTSIISIAYCNDVAGKAPTQLHYAKVPDARVGKVGKGAVGAQYKFILKYGIWQNCQPQYQYTGPVGFQKPQFPLASILKIQEG